MTSLDFWTSEGVIEKTLTSKKLITSFSIDEEAQYPHSIDLKMTGRINGSGVLSIGWIDTVSYKSDTIPGRFEIDYNSDWYNDTCFVSFEPLNGIEGKLLIDYKIYSSRK